MVARIEIGRVGFRGAKAVHSSDPGAIEVKCTELTDPAHKKRAHKKRREDGTTFSLAEIKALLLEHQHKKTQQLVQKVIDGVLEGKVVCVKCMMGRNRSQAVASIACDELARSYPGVEYEGPVYLGPIRETK